MVLPEVEKVRGLLPLLFTENFFFKQTLYIAPVSELRSVKNQHITSFILCHGEFVFGASHKEHMICKEQELTQLLVVVKNTVIKEICTRQNSTLFL
jgi:hypothetical protein